MKRFLILLLLVLLASCTYHVHVSDPTYNLPALAISLFVVAVVIIFYVYKEYTKYDK